MAVFRRHMGDYEPTEANPPARVLGVEVPERILGCDVTKFVRPTLKSKPILERVTNKIRKMLEEEEILDRRQDKSPAPSAPAPIATREYGKQYSPTDASELREKTGNLPPVAYPAGHALSRFKPAPSALTALTEELETLHEIDEGRYVQVVTRIGETINQKLDGCYPHYVASKVEEIIRATRSARAAGSIRTHIRYLLNGPRLAVVGKVVDPVGSEPFDDRLFPAAGKTSQDTGPRTSFWRKRRPWYYFWRARKAS